MNKEESDVYETWEFCAQYPASDQRSRSNSCQSSSSSSSSSLSSLSSSSSRQSSEGDGSLIRDTNAITRQGSEGSLDRNTVTELEFYGSVKFRDCSTLRELRDTFTEDDDNYDDVYNSLDSGDDHRSYSTKLREQSSFFFQS